MPRYYAMFLGCRVKVGVSDHAFRRINESGIPENFFREALESGKASITSKISDVFYVLTFGSFEIILDVKRMIIKTVISTSAGRKHCGPPKLASIFNKQKAVA